MPKKPGVRTVMDSQHVKGSERLIFFDHSERKSAQETLF